MGDRWQVGGRWHYVYRAIDQFGQVIDVFVSARRDATAAHRFFERAIGATKVTPVEVTPDQAAVYPAVLESCCQRHGTALTGTPTTYAEATTSWRSRNR